MQARTIPAGVTIQAAACSMYQFVENWPKFTISRKCGNFSDFIWPIDSLIFIGSIFQWFGFHMYTSQLSRDKYWKCSYVEDNYNFSSWRVRVNNMVSSAEHRRVEVIIRVKMEFYEISWNFLSFWEAKKKYESYIFVTWDVISFLRLMGAVASMFSISNLGHSWWKIGIAS